jgi:hypothetical protein
MRRRLARKLQCLHVTMRVENNNKLRIAIMVAGLLGGATFLVACASADPPKGLDGDESNVTENKNTDSAKLPDDPPPPADTKQDPAAAATDPDKKAPDTQSPKTGSACIAACEAQFPNGLKLGQDIDSCMSQKCTKACAADGDGQVHGAKTRDCRHGVGTHNENCSECVAASCCQVWDRCFDNAECKALNDCASQCAP